MLLWLLVGIQIILIALWQEYLFCVDYFTLILNMVDMSIYINTLVFILKNNLYILYIFFPFISESCPVLIDT